MATLPELENALRKADAAGNVDDARALANAIRQMRAKPDFSTATGRMTGTVQGKSTDSDFARLISGKKKAPATYNLTGRPGVSTQIGGLLDALQHRAMDPLHGVAQLVGHGVKAGTDLLPEGNPVRRYVADTVAQDDAAMREREEDYQARTAGNATSNLGAVAGTVAPFVVAGPARALQATGEKAAGLIPKAPGLLRKMISGGTQGAAIGATQPVLGDDYASDKAAQVGVGGATGGALPAVAGSVRGLVNAAKPVYAPQQVANSQLARMLDADQQTVGTLRGAQLFVPGEVPTTAQVLQTPRAVQVEKAMRNRADMKAGFTEQDNANNAARLAVLRRHAGDEDALTQARNDRRALDKPFRDANLPEQGSKMVDAAPLIATLTRLSQSANTVVRGAAREHLSLIRGQTKDGKVPAFLLDDIRQNTGVMLAKHSPGPIGGATPEAAKYAPVSSQIIRSLDSEIPGYSGHLAAYRGASVPINTMETTQRILAPVEQRGLNSAGDARLTLGQLNTGLNRADKSRYGLSPDARTDIEGVRQSLQRESVSNSLPSAGSDTAYNLSADGWLARQLYGANMQGASPQAMGIARLIGVGAGAHAGGPVGAAVGLALPNALKAAADKINQRVTQRVSAGMRDPQEAARMIESFLQQNPKQAPALLEAYPQWAALISGQ